MDSDNWVVQNLENALNTWNTKMAEVWSLLTMSPQSFKGGGIWHVILQINGAVKGIGLAQRSSKRHRPGAARFVFSDWCSQNMRKPDRCEAPGARS